MSFVPVISNAILCINNTLIYNRYMLFVFYFYPIISGLFRIYSSFYCSNKISIFIWSD
ncbi:hypothetical protein CWI38_2590p0010 [Hamiltosporidium tvaerminnensis]|uniref:Uncharacterized protein n=1 Tax=Hamiltosporidium tvaerminnensis TaxID=1176355 RepID=A0A4Q9LHB5_9MICR|nr:hypothetical protein CWI38_2590p0010 [Hamiltosporidium tvaerminnensis]